jgi:hypothetical protein
MPNCVNDPLRVVLNVVKDLALRWACRQGEILLYDSVQGTALLRDG